MSTLIGRKAMFNPIFNGEIHYSNGIEVTPCVKRVQVVDGTIMGTIVEDRHYEVLIAGPVEQNGWYPLYLMSKQLISLIPTNSQYLSEDQINDN